MAGEEVSRGQRRILVVRGLCGACGADGAHGARSAWWMRDRYAPANTAATSIRRNAVPARGPDRTGRTGHHHPEGPRARCRPGARPSWFPGTPASGAALAARPSPPPPRTPASRCPPPPVSTLTTPPGTSDVASTSASVTAGSGCASLATTTAVFPVAITGARTLTRPSRLGLAGATTATTPVGSGTLKLKYGPATGFAAPATWATLSGQPAYQTQRSIAAPTSRRASASGRPSALTDCSWNCAARPSSSSATRYSTWPRL